MRTTLTTVLLTALLTPVAFTASAGVADNVIVTTVAPSMHEMCLGRERAVDTDDPETSYAGDLYAAFWITGDNHPYAAYGRLDVDGDFVHETGSGHWFGGDSSKQWEPHFEVPSDAAIVAWFGLDVKKYIPMTGYTPLTEHLAPCEKGGERILRVVCLDCKNPPVAAPPPPPHDETFHFQCNTGDSRCENLRATVERYLREGAVTAIPAPLVYPKE